MRKQPMKLISNLQGLDHLLNRRQSGSITRSPTAWTALAPIKLRVFFRSPTTQIELVALPRRADRTKRNSQKQKPPVKRGSGKKNPNLTVWERADTLALGKTFDYRLFERLGTGTLRQALRYDPHHIVCRSDAATAADAWTLDTTIGG